MRLLGTTFGLTATFLGPLDPGEQGIQARLRRHRQRSRRTVDEVVAGDSRQDLVGPILHAHRGLLPVGLPISGGPLSDGAQLLAVRDVLRDEPAGPGTRRVGLERELGSDPDAR